VPAPARARGEAEALLRRMAESIKAGDIGGFIPFDTQGLPIQFN
jgi:hypothetical protein